MSARFKTNISFEATLVFLASLLIFTSALFNREFIGFESRFGLFAQEMLRNGISFFPTTYNQFYPDYPATQTILTYLFSLPVGKVTILTGILPTAITSALTLMFIYLIGAKQSRRWGLCAVLLALFSFDFLAASRSISLDQFIAAITSGCFYCAYTAQTEQKPKYLFWLLLAWILGFAFRGPIGLIIPASVVVGFYCIEKNFRLAARIAISSSLTLVACISLLLLMAWSNGGTALVESVINMQAASRLNETTTPFYYYFIAGIVGYAISFPLAYVVIGAHTKQLFKTSQNSTALHLLRHLAVWTLIILIGLSIPSAKKIRYILPAIPAIALSAAYLFVEDSTNRLLIIFRKSILILCALLPFIGLGLLLACKIYSHTQQTPLDIHYGSGIFFLTLWGLGTLIIQRKKLFNNPRRELVQLALGTATFVTIYILAVQPIEVQRNNVRPFVDKIESLRQPQQQIAFYHVGPDAADIKFMVALNKPIQPLFLQKINEVTDIKAPTIFIARKTDFDQFPSAVKDKLNILFIDRLGRLPCVVFVKKT